MAYNITLTNGTELITGGLLDNTTDSVNSSLALVGKNFKSYGLFLNQNFVRLMENFALGSAPTSPLPGQIWFNSNSKLLNVNIAATKGTASAVWKTIAGMTLSSTTPDNAYTGELWYNTDTGQVKLYTGTAWSLIGPLTTFATGNTGAVPDTVTDSPPTTTFVVIKFFIDDLLVGLWSNDGPFQSDVTGFPTIKKGLNLNPIFDQTFWGNSEVANSIYVNGVATAGNAFLRSTTSGSINGSLTLTNNGGLTFGAANDFVGNVVSGNVILKNQTNNRDFILSLKTGGNQQPFLRGNYVTGLSEAYQHPVASSPPLSFATKNYVDTLSGSVNGTANFLGHVTPSANLIYTLGNTTNRWSNVFAQSVLVGNVYAANTFATVSNIAQIYLSADITPVTNNTSNIGSTGRQFNTVHARAGLFNTTLNIGSNLTVGGNVSITSNTVMNGNLNISGNITSVIGTRSISTITGALQLTGGAGIGGNLHVGENFVNPLITIPMFGNISTAGNITPSSNVRLTLGNLSYRWENIFSQSILVGNVTAANVVAAMANIAQIYLNTDILPVTTVTSNIGSTGMQFNTLHTRFLRTSSNVIIGGNANIGANLGISGNITVGGNSVVIGNVSIRGNATVDNQLSVGDTIDAAGNIVAASSAPSISTTTGAIVSKGGLGVAGVGMFGGNIVAVATTPSTSTTTGAIVSRGGAGVAGAVYIGGILDVTGNIVADSATTSTSTTTGALVVKGGAGIGGDVVLGGALIPDPDNTGFVGNATNTWANGQFTNLTVDSVMTVRGAVDLADNDILRFGTNDSWEFFHNGTDNFIDLNAGDLIIRDNTSQRVRVSRTTGNLVLTSTTGSTSTATGALVVLGGIGVAKGGVFGGNIVADSDTASTSTTTGALVVVGGAGISKRLNVGGNIVAVATTPSTSTTTGAIVSRGGLGVAGVGMFGGNIVAVATTPSTSTTTGALVVRGGAGIAGAVYVGGLLDVTGNIVADSATAATSTTTGALVVKGGVGVGGVGMFGGNIVGTATTAATSTTTGAIVSRGGLGVAGVGIFGGNIVAAATTASTSSTTGALVVRGGTGISGRLNVGGPANFNDTVSVTGDLTAPTMPTGTKDNRVATTEFVVNNAVPTGALVMWSTSSAPDGYLLCNGTAVSRTVYADLFAVIGTTFGGGNGSSTFNLPNYTNRMPVGAGGLYPLSERLGSKDAIVPAHSHTGSVNTAGAHVHTYSRAALQTAFKQGQSNAVPNDISTQNTGSAGAHTHTITINETGDSVTGANMPPYLSINFIIRI
jgi:microcystin-dependent protein